MTTNKKFKKLVRARMRETGETYMQARRALGGDGHSSADQDAARQPKSADAEDVAGAALGLWHEVWDRGSCLFHIYADGQEDGRAHTSLCGGATTETWETKTPGHDFCERCQLLRIQQILEQQKDEASPLHALHNQDLWARMGGDEAERVRVRDEVWGPPPGQRRMRGQTIGIPSFMEIESPFNPGWYYNDAQYPDEGSVGPYETEQEAREAARLGDYDPDDAESVRIWEQKTPAAVLRRFAVEHLRGELLTTLHEFAGRDCTLEMRDQIQQVMVDRLRDAIRKLERDGVLTPPENSIGMEFQSSDDGEDRVLQGRIWLKHPERYPELVRELQEVGVLEPRYLISMKLRQED